MIKLFIYVLLLFYSVILTSAEINGKVIKVMDGDTVKVLDSIDNAIFNIRMEAIDAPEKNQEYGIESKKFLSNLVLNKNIKVKFIQCDRYGRIVGILYLGDKNINRIMIETGNAWHYKKYNNDREYSELELNAKRKGIGLWKTNNPISPWEFRNKK